MKVYLKKNAVYVTKKVILTLCAGVTICGCVLSLSYNDMMTNLTRQQQSTITATVLNRMDMLFSENEDLLRQERNHILSQKENTSDGEMTLKTLADNKLESAPWYLKKDTLSTYDPTISKSQLRQLLPSTQPSQKDTSSLTRPYQNPATGEYYLEHFVTIGIDTYLGYHIPLKKLNAIARSNTKNVHSFMIYRDAGAATAKYKHIRVTFDSSVSLLFHGFTDISYNNEPYIGTTTQVSDNNWYLVVCSSKRAVLKNTIITTLLLSLLVFTAVIITITLIHYLRKDMQKKRRDSLTHAYTLSGFIKQFEKQYKSSSDIYDYCICQFDIHNFKMINELEGTDYGDKFLKKIYLILLKNLPKHSIICRIHSDVFCFSFPFHSKKHTQYMLEDITERISDIHVNTISIYYGLYICHVNEQNIASAVDYAGIALKHIKGSPLSNRCYFEDYMLDDLSREANIEADMYTALTEKQFKVYLQPKCSMESGCVIGAEALVRWEHPTKGRICPDVFIPLFEKNGFITKLDEYMWNETAALIADWHMKKYPIIPISVNISRAQKLGYPLCQKFQLIIDKYRIPAHYLQLEFTESAFGEDTEELYKTMQSLHNMGFTILMDDFGSGYSSLNMLKQCSADIIKIDKEFLKDITTEDKTDSGTILLQNIVHMLLKLNLGVVVEGVETENHVNMLMECGCDTAQGYYYSPPLTVDEFIEFAFSPESPHRVA